MPEDQPFKRYVLVDVKHGLPTLQVKVWADGDVQLEQDGRKIQISSTQVDKLLGILKED